MSKLSFVVPIYPQNYRWEQIGLNMHPEIDPEVLKELWYEGHSLSQARNRFSNPQISQQEKEKLEEIEQNPDQAIEGMKQYDWESSEFSKTLKGVVIAVKPYTIMNEARWEREREVIARLAYEQLIGVGFSLPRTASDFPQLIPSDVWRGKPNWDESSVSGQGLEFVSVRIIPMDRLNSITLDAVDQPNDLLRIEMPIAVGRPSVKAEILEAYESLKIDGKIDFNASMKSHFDLFRIWLGDKYPDRKGQFTGLADETIRKEISPLFKTDKATQ